MQDTKIFLEQLKSQLTHRELSVVEMAFFCGSPKSPDEIGTFFGVTGEEIKNIIDGLKNKYPELYKDITEQVLYRQNCYNIVKAIAPEKSCITYNDAQEILESILSESDERDKTVINMRFGLYGEKPKTLREIGECLNVSGECVRQKANRILFKISQKTREKIKEKESKRKKFDFSDLDDEILKIFEESKK